MRAADEDAFVAQLVGSLGSFPPYFLRLAEVNRRGPAVLGGTPRLDRLSPSTAMRLLHGSAVLVDVRPVTEYAQGHVGGSLSIPLREAFATWLGWLAPPDQPLLVLRSADQDPDEVAWQAVKIGYENLVGELAGGIDAWIAAALPVTATPLVGPDAVVGPEALDVRQRSEYAGGHLPGARHVELGALPARAAGLPDQPVVVMCSHGERAATGASLLERAGHDDVSVLVGGTDDWAAAHGLRPETGG